MYLTFSKPWTAFGETAVHVSGASEDQLDILFCHEFVTQLKVGRFTPGCVILLDHSAVDRYGAARVVALLEEELFTDSVELDDRWYEALENAFADRQ